MSSGRLVKGVLSVLAVVSAASVFAQEKVRIAVVGPLSGAAAHYGKDNERGAQLAVDELNAPALSKSAARPCYKAAYNSNLVVYAPYAYDNVMILARAMQAAGSAEPAKYLPSISKTKYDGITGLIEFDGSGQRKKAAVTLSTYPKGVKTTLTTMR